MEVALSRSTKSVGSQEGRFIYPELPHPHSIRIISLHPADRGTIECDISTIVLDSVNPKQQYEAVSYVWGLANDPGALIYCNGKPMTVTTSLHEALQHFRLSPSGGKRTLWADGICIDQSNSRERSHQVQLMRRIYRQASRVLIWLGLMNDYVVMTTFDLVCRVAGDQAPIQGTAHPEKALERTQRTPAQQNIWWANIYSERFTRTPLHTTFATSELHILYPLFECTWFERLWTFQELALSCAAIVFWGRGQIDFRHVGATALYLLDHHQTMFLRSNVIDGLKRCCIMYNYWTSAWDEVTFFGLLVLTRRAVASDARDKVFGLLGLLARDSDPEHSNFVDPDYTLSVIEVYFAVAKKILLQLKEVDILAVVQHDDSMSDTLFKYSWIPDWTTIRTTYLCNGDRNTSKGVDSDVIAHTCDVCISLGLGDSIAVRGMRVDEVKYHLTLAPSGKQRDWSNMAFLRYLQSIVRDHREQYDEITLAHTFSGGYASDGYVVQNVEAHLGEYRAFANWDPIPYVAAIESVYEPLGSDPEHVKAAYRYYANCGPTMLGRGLFLTRGGKLGLGPLALEKWDIVVVLFGGSVPFIIRPQEDGEHYRLVGECYVYDIMEGQAVDAWQQSGKPATYFKLI